MFDGADASQADIEATAGVVATVDQVNTVPSPAAAPSSGHWLRLQGLLTPYLAIGLGGALGANARSVIGSWGTALWGADFPYATFFVNVTGSFVLGFYLTLVTERFTGRTTTRLLVTTGFLGAYTTFSTFSVETLKLLETGAVLPALTYVVASVVLSLIAATVGIVAAHAL